MIRAVVFDLWNTLVHSQNGDPFQHLQRLLEPGQEARFPELKRDAMSHPHPDAQSPGPEAQGECDRNLERPFGTGKIPRTELP